MLLSSATHGLSRKAIDVTLHISPFLLLFVTTGFAQRAQPEDGGLPKCDLHTEMKTNGAVDEVTLFQRRWATVSVKALTRSVSESEAERGK